MAVHMKSMHMSESERTKAALEMLMKKMLLTHLKQFDPDSILLVVCHPSRNL